MKKSILMTIFLISLTQSAFANILDSTRGDFVDLDGLKGQTIVANADVSYHSLMDISLEPDTNVFRATCEIHSPVNNSNIKFDADMIYMHRGSVYQVVNTSGEFHRSQKLSWLERTLRARTSNSPRVHIGLTLQGAEGIVQVDCGAEGEDDGEAIVPYNKVKSVLNLLFTN